MGSTLSLLGAFKSAHDTKTVKVTVTEKGGGGAMELEMRGLYVVCSTH